MVRIVCIVSKMFSKFVVALVIFSAVACGEYSFHLFRIFSDSDQLSQLFQQKQSIELSAEHRPILPIIHGKYLSLTFEDIFAVVQSSIVVVF